MAVINDLVNQIEDKALRERIAAEVERLTKQKKVGLVFEEHLPECTPLYDVPVRRGSTVARKSGPMNVVYRVLQITDGMATCVLQNGGDPERFRVDELVSVAEFGDPIYPQLIPMDTVENAPDSDLWHTLIQADNYHALQLLEYLYTGKVDCIYIDPPYNTGARDWKYNNDYVDGNDVYRHTNGCP
jgi:adenine-specific DNA-methyltransferase